MGLSPFSRYRSTCVIERSITPTLSGRAPPNGAPWDSTLFSSSFLLLKKPTKKIKTRVRAAVVGWPLRQSEQDLAEGARGEKQGVITSKAMG